MYNLEIFLNDIDSIKSFFNVTSNYEEDIDISKGSYTVDAKSLMGIFSLDLSKPLLVTIHADNENTACNFAKDLEKNNIKIMKETE